MTREQALRKVMACLRMAEASSANSHEAATALRQAQSLMNQFGLSVSEVSEDAVDFVSAKTRYRGGELPVSLIALSAIVARMYGCKSGTSQGKSNTEVFFYGTSAEAAVASYAFTVLRRMMERDRSKYLARVRKAANRRSRGELFALGWVDAIRVRLPGGALPHERAEALDRAYERRYGAAEITRGKSLVDPDGRGKQTIKDRASGFLKGRLAHVAPGLEGGQESPGRLQLEHQA